MKDKKLQNFVSSTYTDYKGRQFNKYCFFSEEIARLTKENFELRNKLSSGTTFSTPNEALYLGLIYDELEV